MKSILVYSGIIILLSILFISWPLLLWIRMKRRRDQGKIILAKDKKVLNNAIILSIILIAWLVIAIITTFLFR